MSDTEYEKRFLTLETKVAYQEKMLADLNDVLLQRGSELDQLEKRVRQLERQLVEGPPDNPEQEVPPHY